MPFDITITAETATKSRRPRCRYDDEVCTASGAKQPHDNMAVGTNYISIKGWGAGGSVTLCVCEHHADDFFKQITKVKRDLKKLQK